MPDEENSQNQRADNFLSFYQQINKQANYSMVATQQEGMVLQLADGSIQACNTVCERILGLTADQLIGRTSVDLPWQSIHEDGSFFPGETHPAMVALQTGEPCLNVVMGLYKPNGELIWLLLNSEPLFQAGKTTPYAVVTTFSDITQSANILSVADKLMPGEITGEQTQSAQADLESANVSKSNTEIAQGQSNEQFELVAAAVNCLVYDWEIQNGTVERNHWLAAKGRSFYDALDKLLRMMGATQDVSDALRQAASVGDAFIAYPSKRASPNGNSFGERNAYLMRSRISNQTEQALRQSEEDYRFLADTIPEMVWTTDAQGLASYVNQRWYEYTGLTLEETVGEGWRKVLHPDDVERSAQLWAEALQNGIPYEIEHRYKRAADNTYRWHLVRGLPLKDDQGRVVKWFGTCTDIHEQKQIEEERAQILEREKAARAEAEAANRIKDEFLAVLSHELRSPLNPILGWSKLLKSRKFDEVTTFRALDTIERNAKLQIQLIDDLLDVSRILRGKLCLNVAAFDLALVINAAIETVRLAAQEKSIEMHLRIDPNVGKVLVDFNRLQQVVGNLLNNAIKFTCSGGRVDIRLSVGKRHGKQENNNYAQITVSDTGKGISSEFLPHVFEYFRQADSSTTRKYGGLGLGLAIVRHLVELHGGTVAAESPGVGQGATFIVRLPLINDSGSEQKKENGTEAEKFNFLPLAGIRILIVDDEVDTREFMSFLLQEQGAEVTVASSVSEAIKEFAQSPPDILLSDLGMPVVDGYSLISQIRTMPPEQGGQIPAIALTAYAGESDRDRAFAAGFQKHLAKPVEPTVLLALIADLLKKN